MEQARIQLDLESLDRSAAGLVRGRFLLQIGQTCFPDLEWTDFVVIVMGWWCDAALRVLEGDRGPVEVRFMDGPFLAELRPTQMPYWNITLIEDGRRRRIRDSVDVDVDSFVANLLICSESLLKACRTKGWWSSDANDLLSASMGLRNHKKNMTH